MALTNAARDLLLTTWRSTIAYYGLANETGTEASSGGYARIAVTWDALSGAGQISNSADMAFTVPSGFTVARVMPRAIVSGGTDYGWFPVGGNAAFVAAADATSNALTNYAHGLANDNRVYLEGIYGNVLPTGLTAGTLYYVVNASTNAFQVSLTSGGAAVDITGSSECYVLPCTPQQFPFGGTYTISAGNLTASARLL